MVTLTLPFSQDPEGVVKLSFWKWDFYLNRAREYGPIALGRRIWISWKTRPKGFFSRVTDENRPGKVGFVHRITTVVRKDKETGVKYLQLVFFSWWVAVVRKEDGKFAV